VLNVTVVVSVVGTVMQISTTETETSVVVAVTSIVVGTFARISRFSPKDKRIKLKSWRNGDWNCCGKVHRNISEVKKTIESALLGTRISFSKGTYCDI
jgi:hypothetical protein